MKTDNPTWYTDFDRWMQVVTNTMVKHTGIHPNDIEDWDYAGAFEAGMRPGFAAHDALQAAGFFA